MAGVAIHGSNIVTVTKPNHVTYTIENWVDGYCSSYDEFGNCTNWVSGYWSSAGTGSTGARITGTVSAPSSKMKIQGSNVAKIGDATIESWVADPPVPSSTSSTRYTPIGPTSGSGQGKIAGGSSKGKLSSQGIALIGSRVETHLDNYPTSIQNGNTKMNMPS